MELTSKQGNDLIDYTLNWAGETAELWVGTLYSSIIHNMRSRLAETVAGGDQTSAVAAAMELAQALSHAECEYGS